MLPRSLRITLRWYNIYILMPVCIIVVIYEPLEGEVLYELCMLEYRPSARGPPFCLRKIITDPQILAHLNIECADDRYWKLDISNLRTDIRWLRTHTSSIRNNALHDFTFIKLTVARCVGTGFFFSIRYFNDYSKVVITEIYPGIPWELVADPSGRDPRSILSE